MRYLTIIIFCLFIISFYINKEFNSILIKHHNKNIRINPIQNVALNKKIIDQQQRFKDLSEKLNDITLAVAKYSQNIPFGIVDFDKKLNFKSLREKPIIDHYILSGIYFLNKKVCNFVNAEYLDMTSLIEKAHLLNCKVGIYPIYESWKDIGNIEDFKQAENSLIRK